MTAQPETEVIAVMGATPARRFVAVGMLAGCGVILWYMTFFRTTPEIGSGVSFVVGALALVAAEVTRKATSVMIELTPDGLRDTEGKTIVNIADVVSVDRGVLAFKPTHGFMMRTETPNAPGWRFGLWWRYGRYIGVGGMVPSGQSRAMADRMAQMIAERDLAD